MVLFIITEGMLLWSKDILSTNPSATSCRLMRRHTNLTQDCALAGSMLANLDLHRSIGISHPFKAQLLTLHRGYWFSGPQDVNFFRAKLASLCPSHESATLLNDHRDIVVPFHLSSEDSNLSHNSSADHFPPNPELNHSSIVPPAPSPPSKEGNPISEHSNRTRAHPRHPIHNHHPNHTLPPTTGKSLVIPPVLKRHHSEGTVFLKAIQNCDLSSDPFLSCLFLSHLSPREMKIGSFCFSIKSWKLSS